jgi:nitroimidazol reductase NimA-like FMN-containing flavoprotein (pyridoxamine 5'-phosphate oxidase superfamily)
MVICATSGGRKVRRTMSAQIAGPVAMGRLKALILRSLYEHRVMTMATLRPDGWPQATMVGYVNDGFLLYCFVARSTQKLANIQRDPRVSIAIGSDATDPLAVRGLSLAGHASEVEDQAEFAEITALRLQKFPEYAALPAPLARQDGYLRIAATPRPSAVALLRIAPDVISVLDYESGFGQSELVTFSERDLDVHLGTRSHPWNASDEII